MKEAQGSGGIERRVDERVEIQAEMRWSRVESSVAKALVNEGAYSGLSSGMDPSAGASQESLERQAYTDNLSISGLKLVGDLRLNDGSDLEKGWELKVEIEVPGRGEPVRALAEVMWVAPVGSSPPRQAGLFFKAVNKGDVERLLRASAKRPRPA